MLSVRANILKEDIDGKKEETEITEWKTKSRNESGDTKKESVQTLAEDGLYKLRMNVTDMAGNVSHAERQLIIDKENPVIAHVDELYRFTGNRIILHSLYQCFRCISVNKKQE